MQPDLQSATPRCSSATPSQNHCYYDENIKIIQQPVCIKEDQLKNYITVYKTMNNAKITQFVCQYSMVDGYWIANVQCQLQV